MELVEIAVTGILSAVVHDVYARRGLDDRLGGVPSRLVVVQEQVDPPVPQDEVQGPLQVGHAVHDADVAAGHGSVRGASSLDEGEEVEKPFEHGDGPIGRAGRDYAVGSKISRRGIGSPLSSGSGFCTS